MTRLWGALRAAYRILGYESAAKSDNVFRDVVLARSIEPSGKGGVSSGRKVSR